ncbi:hypothetical protein C8J57DRAFT_1318737 [Mycena rebaudengoi]|nr:hypothetical protein C8J57DRAFT_1318737 [Mycena rebaudengoi]
MTDAMARVLDFPQEIIDAIVDKLAEDTASLKACSLTATAFVTPTRRQIFRTMRLTTDDTIRRSHDIIALSPHLLRLFRALVVNFAGPTSSLVQRVPFIMNSLNTIESLYFVWYNSDFGPALETSILRILSYSCFKNLQLYKCCITPSFIVSAISASPTMTLGLRDTRVAFDPDCSIITPPPISSPPPALESLILSVDSRDMSASAFLLHPHTAPYLRSLKHLDLDERFGEEFFTRFIQITSPTLETLILRIQWLGDPLSDLPPLPNLRWVEFRLSEYPESRIDGVVRQMRLVAPQVEVRTLISYTD